jgi:hypothetical protein
MLLDKFTPMTAETTPDRVDVSMAGKSSMGARREAVSAVTEHPRPAKPAEKAQVRRKIPERPLTR